MDTGASRVDIRFEDAEDGRYVVVKHDGEPIEGYLNAFLTIGTDYKARKGNRYIRMYGIGRLSWLLIGDKAIIETGDNRLIWEKDRIMELDHEPLVDRVDGVRWEIRLMRHLTMEVANYLRSVSLRRCTSLRGRQVGEGKRAGQTLPKTWLHRGLLLIMLVMSYLNSSRP